MFTLPREDVFKAFQNRQSVRRYDPNKKISQNPSHGAWQARWTMPAT